MRRATLIMVAVATLVMTGCYQDFDFTADHKADHVFVDSSTGDWKNADTDTLLYDAQPQDIPVPEDWDGDHLFDVAVVRPNGDWVRVGAAGTISFPAPPALAGFDPNVYGAVPVPGDYDGDGAADPAWYRNTDSVWFIAGENPVTFGSGPTVAANPVDRRSLDQMDADYPVPADYDGDGRTDLSTYNPRTMAWKVRSSATGTVSTVVMAGSGIDTPSFRRPAPGDYDGVGHAQRAVVDNGGWYVEGHDQPIADPPACYAPNPSWWCLFYVAPADYDGDGRTDPSYVADPWDYGDPRAGRWHTSGSETVLSLDYDQYPVAGSYAQLHESARFQYLAMVLAGV